MAAYTTIDNPELYFQCKLYTGNGSTNAITLDGDENMQPDLLWLKRRDGSDNHILFDDVRGVTKGIYADLNNAEDNLSDSLSSFNTDGFTLGADTASSGTINGSSETYVAWCWKESATAGFDIVSYTGNATVRTISHSLSAVPHFIIIKNRDFTRSWLVGSKGLPSWSYHVYLDTTDDQNSDNNMFNGTTPTSSVFSLGNADEGNQNTDNMIAYLFSEKQGFSKFGKYIGNGNANGTFVYTGFRPAWIMIKNSIDNSTSWLMYDNKRPGYNSDNAYLLASASDSEASDKDIDILSNGFKIRVNNSENNTSGKTYIYMAFAEQPFVNSKGVPANAR